MQVTDFGKDILPLKEKLLRLALRMVCDRAEAEDIVQETLMRVWNHREEWDRLESVEAYCLTVARNLAIDRTRREEARTVELAAEAEGKADGRNPHDELEEKERLMLVKRLVEALPERQRQIVLLRDMEGKSYREIAALLDVTEEVVKVNLFRARQKVKRKFMEIDGYGL